MSVTVYCFTVMSTATNIQNCAAPLVNNLSSAYSNALNINGQTAQLQQQAQNALNNINIFNPLSFLALPAVAANIASSGVQLAASVPVALAQLTTALLNALTQIPACGTTAATTAGQQLNNTLANVQRCTQSG